MHREGKQTITVGLAQIAPVWLNRQATTDKIIQYIAAAGEKGCSLVVFGEAFLPGYPFWLSFTGGAQFDDSLQKKWHAHYMQEAVQISQGDLAAICQACKAHHLAAIVGCIELAKDRGNHSLYCSLVYIDATGNIASVHRKLVPTYEERLSWSPGDGHGLRVHPLEAFTLGALNCWENWMPLPRAALYAQGEDLHVAIWPGNLPNTQDITRFIARESRSYVVSVSGLLRKEDITDYIPHSEHILAKSPAFLGNGGSCVAAPNGEWVLAPVIEEETLLTVAIDHAKVREERQNFDASGHYARPDVTQLTVNRQRQSIITLED